MTLINMMWGPDGGYEQVPSRQKRTAFVREAKTVLLLGTARLVLELDTALEFDRRIRRHFGQAKLQADIEGELHLRLAGDLIIVVVTLTTDIVITGVEEQGRADAVVLVIEGA
jgi:hypothetical protein